ncbi:hypothetical protein V502_09425 [Pseudogymnoascus sp. VKM F-4520 (FW-2644)]|nr:hypothetical protein V502_09425 [Pseudogymnoascus sp. VKM F-4520 (FW-2644)]
MATATTLLSLPTEILHQITSNLRYSCLLALSFTCRELHARVEDPNSRPRRIISTGNARPYSMQDLINIEVWPEFAPSLNGTCMSRQMASKHDFFACRYCCKLRSAIHFTHRHLNRPYWKRDKDEEEISRRDRCKSRICISCGAAARMYPKERSFAFGGMSGGYAFACVKCESFVEERPGFEGDKVNFTCDTCREIGDEKKEPPSA